MGVYHSFYVIYGKELNPENERDSNFINETFDGDGKYVDHIVYDVMTGQYAYLGLIVATGDQFDYDETEHAQFDPDEYKQKWDEFKEKFREDNPEYRDLVDGVPKFYAFMHHY